MVKPRRDFITWTLRVLVALIFVYEGLDKFGTRRLWIRVFTEIGIGQWFRYATGIIEILGAGLLLVPRTTLIGAAVLLCVLAGAFLAHIFIIGVGVPHSVIVAVLFAAVITIAWRHHRAGRY